MKDKIFYARLYDMKTHTCRILQTDSELGTDKDSEYVIESGYLDTDDKRFEYDKIFSILAFNGICSLNAIGGKEIPEDMQGVGAITLDTSSVFAWGYTSYDWIKVDDLPELFEFWLKDKDYGPTVWWCIHEGLMPQEELVEEINEMGIWNLADYNLKPNEG